MNIKRYHKRVILFLLALFLMDTAITVPHLHAEEKKGSILFRFAGISNATFFIYKVGFPDGNDGYSLVGAFADLPDVDLFDKSAAATLKNYVDRDQIIADEEGLTNDSGEILFSDLSIGAYLILGSTYERAGTTYTAQPVLISIPSQSESEGMIYDLEVDAKYTQEDTEPPEKGIDVKAKKVWNDNNDKKRPDSVVVQLCNEDGVYTEEELNKGNNWTAQWKGLPVSTGWYVTEKYKVDGYTVSIEKQDDGKTYIITNKKKDKTTKKTDKKKTRKKTNKKSMLPQTGQLWWPVGVLLSLGLFNIIIGIKIRKE